MKKKTIQAMMAMAMAILCAVTLMLAGCSDNPAKPAKPLELHEDVAKLSQLNPYVGIVVVLRGPLYLVAVASIIAAIGFLLRADAYHTAMTNPSKGKHED